jgi:hypothetical protein
MATDRLFSSVFLSVKMKMENKPMQRHTFDCAKKHELVSTHDEFSSLSCGMLIELEKASRLRDGG